MALLNFSDSRLSTFCYFLNEFIVYARELKTFYFDNFLPTLPIKY